MSSQLVLQILGAAGLSGILGAVVNGVINRHKLGAEATEIITKAAGGMVERLQAEITRKDTDLDDLREQVAKLTAKVEESDRTMIRLRETLQIHALWDYKAFQIIKSLHPEKAVALGDPPPLTHDF